jgi:hypothetical protein
VERRLWGYLPVRKKSHIKALRNGRERCKGSSEWSQLAIPQAAVATPAVVAVQVDVFPFQLELYGHANPIAVSPVARDKVTVG